ncbi:MAG: response regulator [Deltaproteobacteria bacterium]|nr:response regulator [Deltaproteobacteria bacterium]
MIEKTILVIEDNEMNMKLMRAVMAMGKFRMLEASNADTGIRLAREHRPDLILMDIQLPDMDGLSAARIIKENPLLREIPIIAVSGYAMHSDREKALEAGCIGYITKPFNVKELIQIIRECVYTNTVQQ